jgi:hypothetical protein
MQAALQWYFCDEYEFVVKGASNTEMIELRSGTHQLPAMITPENWCIADSTPMLTLLDARLPKQRFYPRGIVGAIAAVMEEVRAISSPFSRSPACLLLRLDGPMSQFKLA